MMLNYIKQFLLIVWSVVFYLGLLQSCSTTQPAGSKDYASLYLPTADRLLPEYRMFHHAINRSTLYFQVNAKELLFMKRDGENSMKSRFSIHYDTYADWGSRQILDSATFVFAAEESLEKLRDSIVIPLSSGNKYIVEVRFIDLNRRKIVEEVLPVDKSGGSSSGNFLPVNLSGNVVFNDFLSLGKAVILNVNDSGLTSLNVKKYKVDFPMALPPFASENTVFKPIHADSTFTLQMNKGRSEVLSMDEYGFYFIQKDSSSQKGYSLFCFNKNYPDISNYKEMIAPLRYLTMRNEFEHLQANSDPKAAVDAYWLGMAGSTERARELIRSYYGRVQVANQLFTSYVEGWKSDRGMIYIIFGPPNSVMHHVNGEVWTYGEANNFRSLVFSFSKLENKYSDNDFMLERNPIYKDEWMRAVDIWRQGRVFNPH